MREGDRGPRDTGSAWPDLSLSDPTPRPVTSVERCTPMLYPAGGGGGTRASLPGPVSSATMLVHGGGREQRE